MSVVNKVLADLHDESEELDQVVSALPVEDWARLTPAPGWSIAHQIAHLAWTDSVSLLSVSNPDAFGAVLAEGAEDPGGFIDAKAQAGAQDTPGEILVRWRRGRAELAAALAEVPDGRRLPWFGTRMSVASMATARLMETWAHGQDIADALGITRESTARIKHICRLAIRTRDFAFGLHGMAGPDREFRVELTGPDGQVWTWGPDDAGQKVTGPALDFCLLATQRRNRADLELVAEGDDADRWLDVIQAFAGPPGQGRAPGLG